jgi:hypothetical protein
MKTRQGFVSNSSSSSFCILGCKVTPAIKAALKERFPKETVDGEKEADWEWLDRITMELDLDFVDLDGKSIIGKSLGDFDADETSTSFAELQKTAKAVQKLVGESAPVKLYVGTAPC